MAYFKTVDGVKCDGEMLFLALEMWDLNGKDKLSIIQAEKILEVKNTQQEEAIQNTVKYLLENLVWSDQAILLLKSKLL